MASSKRRALADPQGHVRDFLKSRLFPGARLSLGYSGGLDSTVLLHVLADLRRDLGFSLSAVHVHHGLSVNADAWAEFCRRTCARLDVPLLIEWVDIVVGDSGLEAAARAARYRIFAARDADFVVLAHHLDDQAETFLFRLLRGAGVHGLAAMAEARSEAGRPILRPLLAVSRALLRDYARARAIEYIDDESNADIALTRNWLRHEVIPVLDSRFPACRQVLARTAEQLGESAELLDALAAADLTLAEDGSGLLLRQLDRLGPARARNLLRYWLKRETGVLPSRAWLEDALSQLMNAQPDRHPELRVGDRVLRRRGGHVLLTELLVAAADTEWCWRGESELILAWEGRLCFLPSTGEGLAADRVPVEGARIAWRKGGERLRPDCRRPGRTLKNLLREAAVAAEERGRLPLLYIGDRLAWAAGLGVDCTFQAGPGEPGWLISWCPPGR